MLTPERQALASLRKRRGSWVPTTLVAEGTQCGLTYAETLLALKTLERQGVILRRLAWVDGHKTKQPFWKIEQPVKPNPKAAPATPDNPPTPPNRIDRMTGTYTCPELYAPPSRPGAMDAYRLPSRGACDGGRP